MNSLSQTGREPGILAQATAPLARGWLSFQDKVAQLAGFEDSNSASKVVTAIGVVTLAVSSILGPLGPAVYGAGLWTTGVGAGGIAENYVTKKVANWDEEGEKI